MTSRAVRSTDLPVHPNVLIGRDREIAAIEHVLSSRDVRLLTLTGPPGVGKTRLAVAAAESVADRFADGVAFADLSSVGSPDAVLAEIARSVGLGATPGQPMAARLAARLSDRDLLLVVDNFEHVLPAATDLAALLGRGRQMRLLVTSRERLHVTAEQEFPVPPLPMPRREGVSDLASLIRNPSLALLVERAQSLLPDFRVTSDNAEALVEICIRLDGIPLAIELAAARLKIFSPRELLDRLRDHLALLTGGASDVPARHRTLRAAIAWSHDLLPDAERTLFRRAAVFVGGWTLSAAQQVCGEPGMDVLGTASALLDKNLIRRQNRSDGLVEFSMTDGVREFATQQLMAHAEVTDIRARHAAYFVAEAKQAEKGVGTADETRSTQWAGREQGNVIVALDYCLGERDVETALHLAAALGWNWYLRGRIGDSESALEQVLTLADTVDVVDEDALAGVLLTAGILAWSRGNLPRARELLERCAAVARPADNERRLAMAEAFLGHVARAEFEYDEAADRHRIAGKLFERTGHTRGVIWSRYDLALLARDRGDLATARALFAEALRGFRNLDYRWAVATSAWGLGYADVQLGQVDEAAELLVESLDLYLEFDDSRGVAQCFEALAGVALARSQYQSSARLLAAAAGLRAALAVPLPQVEAEATRRVEDGLVRVMDARSFDRARHDGRTMPITAATALARSVGGADEQSSWRPDPPLTDREHQVAALVATGKTNRQVARCLGVAEKTAEAHVYNIMGKLGAHSRAEVASWATAEGLVPTQARTRR